MSDGKPDVYFGACASRGKIKSGCIEKRCQKGASHNGFVILHKFTYRNLYLSFRGNHQNHKVKEVFWSKNKPKNDKKCHSYCCKKLVCYNQKWI